MRAPPEHSKFSSGELGGRHLEGEDYVRDSLFNVPSPPFLRPTDLMTAVLAQSAGPGRDYDQVRETAWQPPALVLVRR